MSRARGVALFALVVGCGGARHAGRSRGAPAVFKDSSGIPVAMSASALLRPGAVRTLTASLHARGLLAESHVGDQLDDEVKEALAELQKRARLPVTGLPGYQTITALGLDPAKIFLPSPRSGHDR